MRAGIVDSLVYDGCVDPIMHNRVLMCEYRIRLKPGVKAKGENDGK